jgi:hypothetical protein
MPDDEVVLTERELRRIRAALEEAETGAEVPRTYLGTLPAEWERRIAEVKARRPVLRVLSGGKEAKP